MPGLGQEQFPAKKNVLSHGEGRFCRLVHHSDQRGTRRRAAKSSDRPNGPQGNHYLRQSPKAAGQVAIHQTLPTSDPHKPELTRRARLWQQPRPQLQRLQHLNYIEPLVKPAKSRRQWPARRRQQ